MFDLTHDAYFAALRENRLMGLECEACGGITTPPKATCDACGGTSLTPAQLSGKGVIRTYTVIRVAPDGHEAPYIVILTELDEGPWLVGNLEGVDPDSASMALIGKRVKLGHRIISRNDFMDSDGVVPLFSPDDQ